MTKQTQHGGVFFYILLAIALLAGLTYVVSQGNRGNTGFITDEQARLAATEIIDYGNTVANAVQKLRLRGCKDTEISFENNISSTNYTNSNSPSDKSCHVFNITGGNINWSSPPAPISNEWLFTAHNRIGDLGTNNAGTIDFIIAIQNISTEVCIKINEIKNPNILSPNPPSDGGTWNKTPFTGTYSPISVIMNTGHGLTGLELACFNDNLSEKVFYQALIVH